MALRSAVSIIGDMPAHKTKAQGREIGTALRAESALSSSLWWVQGGCHGDEKSTVAPAAALALGLLFTPPVLIAVDAIINAVASLAPDAIGDLGFVSPALAQPGTLTKKQSDALEAYNSAVKNFEQVLGQRRAQINSGQALPNLPGQALYLARNAMIGARKDLTDVLPSRIGRPNKFGIPPAYFDADNEPLIDEYTNLFAIMQAPPANAQNRPRPSRTWSTSELPSRAPRASMLQMPKWQAVSAWGCSLPRPMAIRTSETRARIPTREASRPAHPRTRMAAGSGRRSSRRSQPLIPR